jgi:hypothetical protein
MRMRSAASPRARTIALLSHPNICTIHEVDTHQDGSSSPWSGSTARR